MYKIIGGGMLRDLVSVIPRPTPTHGIKPECAQHCRDYPNYAACSTSACLARMVPS